MAGIRLAHLGVLAALMALTAPILLSAPSAYATTTTISQDTSFVETTVPSGDTVIVEQGATLSMTDVINKGTIINHGKIAFGPFGILTNDGGIINNTGIMDFGLADLINKNGGKINNENGASITFRQAGSPVGHVFENGAGSTIRNAGPITLDDVFGFVNEGTFINKCGGSLLLTGPSTGNAIIDECSTRGQATLLIRSIDLAGNTISGMRTTIRSIPDGALLKAGFTPFSFTGAAGISYKVTVSNYDSRIFSNWENGSGGNSRTIGLPANTTLTAAYDAGNSMRGFTPLTYAGTTEQPDLTVNATSIDGTKTLHMWTIIDPLSTNSSGTTYKVYASNYLDRVFDHWSDGNKDRVRTLTIDKPTTLIAYYKTGISIVSFSAHYHDVDGPGTPVCDDIIIGTCGPFFGNAEKSSGVVSGSWHEGLPRGALCSSGGPINGLNSNGTTFEMTGTYTGTCDSHPASSTVIVSGECGANSEISFTIGGVENKFTGDSTCSA